MKFSAPHWGWTSGRATPSLRPTPMRQRQQTRQDATYRSRKSVQTNGASSEVADLSDGFPEFVDGAHGHGAQVRLEFGEGHFDGIEVGAVGRQEQQPSAL